MKPEEVKQLRRRKPKFLRQDANKLTKLEKNWRKPKGMDSKMRRALKGYRRLAKVGFGSNKQIYGLNKQGLHEIIINNMNDIEKIGKDQIILLSSTLGLKKKIEILKKIKEKKMKISNLKDIDDFIKTSEEFIKKKAEEKKKKVEVRTKSKEELKKKAEEKKEEKSKEEKQDEEKKKILEKPRSGKEGEYK
ncbi:MAG: eL32 family ribosomal protein [Candidatus Nanoarchaeia archaeon]|nr:eL32 family ribosomal protein [Candidatus Nanoarchaeia archaeon]